MPISPTPGQVDFAISTGTAPLFLGNPPTATVEVHVSLGRESKGPGGAFNVSPRQAGCTSNGTPVVPVSKATLVADGILVKVVNPA